MTKGVAGSPAVKGLPASAGAAGGPGSVLGQEDPREESTATHSSILAWESHGQRSLAGYSPWGRKELDAAAHAHACHKGFLSLGEFPSVSYAVL